MTVIHLIIGYYWTHCDIETIYIMQQPYCQVTWTCPSCIHWHVAPFVKASLLWLERCFKINTRRNSMMFFWWNGRLCSSQNGKYDESLKHLEALQELNKDDYKIAMNKAVVEFYKSSQTTTGTLKQTLLAMKNQVTAEMRVQTFRMLSVTNGAVLLHDVSSSILSLSRRFTHQQRTSMGWMMLKIACCTIIKPSSTIICDSTLKPSP